MKRYQNAEARFFQEQLSLQRVSKENLATALPERSRGITERRARNEAEIAAQMFKDGQAQRPPHQGKSAANKGHIMRNAEHRPGATRIVV